MKIKLILIFLLIGKLCFSQIFDEKLLSLNYCRNSNIKNVEEMMFNGWNKYSLFNKEGFLIQNTNYYKKVIRSDCKFKYAKSDSLITICGLNTVSLNTNKQTFHSKYHYDSAGQLSKYRFDYSGIVDNTLNIDNIIIKNNLLVRFTRGGSTEVYFKYNSTKKLVEKLEVSNTDTTFHLFQYNKKGQLTDYIMENKNIEVVYSDVMVWSNERPNKVHIRYHKFDKYGNWLNSYFVTKNGTKYRSKRSIEYFN